MVSLVRIALSRPYTFVVLALLLLIVGPLAALRMPTDIFPDIKIPVIAVVWTYRGLPPEDMSGRVIYYYERQLSSSVNDIEHIESQSLPGIGIVKKPKQVDAAKIEAERLANACSREPEAKGRGRNVLKYERIRQVSGDARWLDFEALRSYAVAPEAIPI